MEYIIFDLEWNNAYNYKIKKGMNEILEIGAIRLNEKLDIVDTFKQLIKPRLSKKLRSSFKNLTHITMDEINSSGVDFNDAFVNFARWCGDGDLLFLSWSTSDLYTLVENFKKFKGTADISFIKKYADAQKYCMMYVDDIESGNQISLANCATKFNIEIDTENLHRALEDCYVTAYCLRKVFDEDKLNGFINNCDISFFEKLVFRNYYINDPDCDDLRIENERFICEGCNTEIKRLRDFELVNNTFKSIGRCPKCHNTYWLSLRAKKTYDNVIISKKILKMNKKRAKKIE